MNLFCDGFMKYWVLAQLVRKDIKLNRLKVGKNNGVGDVSLEMLTKLQDYFGHIRMLKLRAYKKLLITMEILKL